MPRSNARPGFGCLFKIGDGQSPENFDAMAEIVDVPGVGATSITADVTHMTSPGGWVEHIATGVKEGKAFTLPLNFVGDDTDQILLYNTRLASGSKNNYQILFTDIGATTLTFEALITDIEINHNQRSKADINITIQPSGAYTYA